MYSYIAWPIYTCLGHIQEMSPNMDSYVHITLEICIFPVYRKCPWNVTYPMYFTHRIWILIPSVLCMKFHVQWLLEMSMKSHVNWHQGMCPIAMYQEMSSLPEIHANFCYFKFVVLFKLFTCHLPVVLSVRRNHVSFSENLRFWFSNPENLFSASASILCM